MVVNAVHGYACKYTVFAVALLRNNAQFCSTADLTPTTPVGGSLSSHRLTLDMAYLCTKFEASTFSYPKDMNENHKRKIGVI